MSPEELLKSKFLWVFLGWCVIMAVSLSIFGSPPENIRDLLWIGCTVVFGVMLYKNNKLDVSLIIGSILLGPLVLLTYLTIHYDWIGKVDNWIRE